MENQSIMLPAEVAQIAENVSVEKRNEVQDAVKNAIDEKFAAFKTWAIGQIKNI